MKDNDPMIELYKNDLTADLDIGATVAIDTETLGLNPLRDRLCLLQLSTGDGNAHLIQFDGTDYCAPKLKKILTDTSVTKIFHFGRFDIAVIWHYLGALCTPVFCTKIASRLTRTYTDKHGLRDICGELLGIEISKQQQQSDWGAKELTSEQRHYAASDVLYLHRLKEVLERRLAREDRAHLAQASFDYLPHRAELDLSGWDGQDIFAHS